MPEELNAIPTFTRHGEALFISTLVQGGLDQMLAQAVMETPASASRIVELAREELAGKHRFIPARPASA